MAPPSHKGRNIAIIVVLAVVVLGIAMCGGVAYLASTSSVGSGGGNQTQTIAVNTPVPGELSYSQDHRVYEFTLTQQGTVSIAVVGDFDNYLELYREGEQTAFSEDDDSGGSLNALINTTLMPGTYYALVRAFSDGTTGTFTITVNAPSEPDFASGGLGMGGNSTPPPGGGIAPTPGGTASPPYVPSGSAITAQSHRGVVASATGPAPVPAGTQCDVLITGSQTRGGHNCRVRVNCGGNVIYGRDAGTTTYGYVQCSARNTPTGQQLIQAIDDGPTSNGGDPMINLDTGANRISVSDDTGGGNWNVMIQFVGPAPTGPHTAI